MKVIEIKKQGYVWHVDLAYVADHRAKYYAKTDKDTTYQDEYDHAMKDGYDAIDWFENNMRWKDIPADKRKLVKSPGPIDGPDDVGDDDYFESKIREVAA